MPTFEKLKHINQNLDHDFPNGNDPFQIMTRLIEECGELAEQVHIFEDSGVKRKKHGDPNPTNLCREIEDIILCAMQMANYYDVMPDLEKSIDGRYQRYANR